MDGGIEGGLSLETPDGWAVSPGEVPLSFSGRGQAATFSYTVIPARGARDGAYEVRAAAKAGENEYREGYEVIAYPHIEPRHLYRGSSSVVQVAPVDLPDDLRVGYIMGTGDQVPLVLEQMACKCGC